MSGGEGTSESGGEGEIVIASAIDSLDPSQSLDAQEALSTRYSSGLWIIPLESGRFAVFGPDRHLREITEEAALIEVLRSLHSSVQTQYQREIMREKQRRKEQHESPVAAVNAEDLGF